MTVAATAVLMIPVFGFGLAFSTPPRLQTWHGD